MAKSDVELVIRARNEAGNALRNISRAIRDVVDDQKALAGQASSTESRLAELGRELKGLGDKLSRLRGAEKLARDLGKAESALREQVAATRDAQLKVNDLAYAMEHAAKPTKRLSDQLTRAENALQKNRDKTAALQGEVAELGARYREAQVDAGALGASEAELATQTSRASAEFAELQTRLREMRNLSRGALAELGNVDAGSLPAFVALLEQTRATMRDVGESADLTGVDLKSLAQDIDQLEAAAKDLGDLKQLAAAFEQMRQESRQLFQAFNQSQQETERLAREFKNAAAPSKELGEALGRSRAETARLGQDYETARGNVHRLGQALREAGVDTARMTQSQAAIDEALQRTAQTVAESRIELDRLNDTQKVQAAEAKRAAAEEAEAAKQSEDAARQQAENLRKSRDAAKGALQVYREAQGTVAAAEQAFREASDEATRLGQAMAQADQPSAQLAAAFEQARDKAALLRANFRGVREEAAGLKQALSGARLPGSADVQGDSAARIADITTAQKALEAATRDSTRAVERFNQEQAAATLAERRQELEQQAAAEKALSAERERAAVEQAAADAKAEKAAQERTEALRQSREQVKGTLQTYRQAQLAVDQAEQAFREATEQATRLGRAMAQADQPTGDMVAAFERARSRAAALEANFRGVREEAAKLGQALTGARLPDSPVQTDSTQRIEQVAAAHKRLEAATRDSTRAVEAFNAEQDAAALAKRRAEVDRLAAATQALAAATRIRDQSGEAVTEAAQAHRRASEQATRLATALRKAKAAAGDVGQAFAASQAKTQATAEAYEAAGKNLARLADTIKKAKAPSAALVEEFEQAKAEVAELKTEFAEGEKATRELAKELKGAEATVSALGGEFEKAKQRGASLKTNVREVQAAYEGLEAAIRDNADDADALASAQKRLEAALKGSAQGLEKAGQAGAQAEQRLRDYDATAGRASGTTQRLGRVVVDTGRDMSDLASRVRQADASLADFRDQGRKTLSLYQRIRGQVLALTSAYIGLYGVGRGVTSVAQSQMTLEAAQSRLTVAVGDDPAAVGEELEFVNQVADDLKLNVEALTEGYSKYAVAAKLAGATTEQTRAVFLGLAKAGRVNKLTAEEMGRAFKAFEQIFSKNKVTAEELRQQLGDVLPGSVNLLREALEDARGEGELTGDDFDKLLKNGQVTSQALVLFARKLEEKFGPSISRALTSTSAKVADFQNAMTRLRLVVAQSGFLDALGDALKDVTEVLSSPEGQAGARRLGEALGDLVRGFIKVIEYGNEAILVLKLLATALAIKWTANLVAGLAIAGNSLLTFVGRTRMATGAVRLFGRALGAIGLILAGLSIAEWAAEEFPAFGRFWAAMKATLFSGLEDIKGAFQITWVKIKDIISGNIKAAGSIVLNHISRWASRLATFWEAIGVDSMAESLRKISGDLAETAYKGLSAAAKEEIDEIKAAIAEAKKEIDEKYFEEFQRRTGQLNAQGPDYDPKTGEVEPYTGANIDDILNGLIPGYADVIQGAEGKANEAAKRIADQMADELDRVRDRLAELSAETLEERLALVRREFIELIAYLKAAGNEAGLASVESLIDILQAQERINFLNEKRQEQEGRINDLMQFRRDLMQQIEFLQAQGDAASLEKTRALKDQLEQVNAELKEAIEATILWARGNGFEEMAASLDLMLLQLQQFPEKWADAAQINRMFASGAASALGDVGTALGKVVDGTYSWGDAFRASTDAFRQFAADFLRRIADMILQAAILKALTGSYSGGGGGVGGAIVSALGNVLHTGGIAGQDGTYRSVPAAWFENATRYHGGGLAGLKPDEVPAILQRGEEVLTRNDPRHATNGGGGNQPAIKIINTLDPAEVVSAGMSGRAGERVIENYLSRNRQKVKRILG